MNKSFGLQWQTDRIFQFGKITELLQFIHIFIIYWLFLNWIYFISFPVLACCWLEEKYSSILKHIYLYRSTLLYGIEHTFLQKRFVVAGSGFYSYYNLQCIKLDKERKNVRNKISFMHKKIINTSMKEEWSNHFILLSSFKYYNFNRLFLICIYIKILFTIYLSSNILINLFWKEILH